jgi:hypothetical protein
VVDREQGELLKIIVVAAARNVTVKRLFSYDGRVVLCPENSGYNSFVIGKDREPRSAAWSPAVSGNSGYDEGA